MKETIIGIEQAIKRKKASIRRHKVCYAKLKESGICIWCKIRKADSPHVRCKKCMKKLKDKYGKKTNH